MKCKNNRDELQKEALFLSEFAFCAQEGSKEEGTHILTI